MRRRARRSRRYQFVAGRKHRDADTPAHIDVGEAERGRERNLLRPQSPARGQRDMTGRDVFSRRANIRAGLQSRGNNNPALIEAHVLLHENGVGALRHRRAGEDPHRVARRDRL